MKNGLKRLFLLLLVIGAMFLTACTNPSVPAGQVGYLTNEPIAFGEKGEFIDIIIGPSSPGIGWRNQIKYAASYKPWTVNEGFRPSSMAGSTDSRIMSEDKINMEVSVAVVLYILNAPSTPGGNTDKFKLNAKTYFEDYSNFWPDRYRGPFRAMVRTVLGKETYASAKEKRGEKSEEIAVWLKAQFKGTPIGVLSVNISNINPPQRMLAEQELLKATEIAESRQAKEMKLQQAKKEVISQEATNLQAALDLAPDYLRWKELAIKERYAEAFNNLVTGDEARSIKKVIFIPYGTPIAATSEEVKTGTPN